MDITLGIDQVSGELVDELERYTVSEHGKILRFMIHDPQSNTSIRLFSRKKHVLLDDSFMDYLQNSAVFEFRFA